MDTSTPCVASIEDYCAASWGDCGGCDGLTTCAGRNHGDSGLEEQCWEWCGYRWHTVRTWLGSCRWVHDLDGTLIAVEEYTDATEDCDYHHVFGEFPECDERREARR